MRILSISGSLTLKFLEKPCPAHPRAGSVYHPSLSSNVPVSTRLSMMKLFWGSPPHGQLLSCSFALIYFIGFISMKFSFVSCLLLFMYLFSFPFQALPPDRMPRPFSKISLSVFFSLSLFLSLSLSFCYQNLGKPVHRMHWIHIKWKNTCIYMSLNVFMRTLFFLFNGIEQIV